MDLEPNSLDWNWNELELELELELEDMKRTFNHFVQKKELKLEEINFV